MITSIVNLCLSNLPEKVVYGLSLNQKINAKLHLWQEFYKPQLPIAFWTSTQLTCYHIFAVRERRQIPLFCEQLIAPRWSLNHMKAVYGNKVMSFHSKSYQVNE